METVSAPAKQEGEEEEEVGVGVMTGAKAGNKVELPAVQVI